VRRARARIQEEDRGNFDASNFPPALKLVLNTLLKAGCNDQQRIRTLEAVAFDVFMVPVNNPVVSALDATYRAYQNIIQTSAPGTNVGACDGPNFVVMIKTLLEQGDVGGKNKEQLNKIALALKDLDQIGLANYVKVCRMQEPKRENFVKITVSVVTSEWRLIVVSAFKAMSEVEHLPGRPPPSGLEDEMSKWIQALNINN